MNPDDCQALLETAVVLVEVSGDEHRRFGGIYADHAELYSRMLAAQVGDLIRLGMGGYERFGIEIESYVF